MEPLINQFTKNLSGCSGCGNKASNLGSSEFDFLWQNQPKEKEGNDESVRGESDQANSDRGRDTGGSSEEST